MNTLTVITEEAPEGVPEEQRPRTRGDCQGGPRPCPWISCRYHLVHEVRGALHPKLRSPARMQQQTMDWITNRAIVVLRGMDETCCLDVADRGGTTLETIAQLIGLTRERIRQVEVRALLKLKMNPAKRRRLGDEEP